ncbi:DoxX family protein [Paenibacillus xanthanilyticus]|uniref:DoxX family protein n=1 Tax=Paenibacillus xanthanilyticus TaxID=1783531 RepID=A0ABV8K6P8_9BACL
MNKETMKPTVYWISTLLAAGLLFFGGILFIMQGEHQVEEMKHLGYPIYILPFLGIGRILGSIAIVIPRFPRLKEWAYAGLVFDLIGASASHAYAGDSLLEIAFPLVFLGLIILSWVLRPPSRKL